MRIEELGRIIKKRRAVLGLTQNELSELSEVGSRTIYKIESGEGNPTLTVISKILEILGLSLDVKIRQK